MKVVLASKNRHKWEEIRKITEKFDMELVMESDLGVDIDVEETGTTFEENSFLKANAVMRATGLPALADDSGIAVDALNGEPGIYSARYGFDDTLDDWGRLQLLLKNTENVPDGQRQAQFVCVITMVTPEGTLRCSDSMRLLKPKICFGTLIESEKVRIQSDLLWREYRIKMSFVLFFL